MSYLRAASASKATPAAEADAAFDAWLRDYTSEFAFRSITPADMMVSYFRAFPSLRGDWSPEAWAKEEAAEASQWWDRPGETPEDFSKPAEPLSAYDPLTAPPDAQGRRGLAYRPGFELMRWMHAPGWPPYYPPLAAAVELSAPAEACLAAWLAATSSAAASGGSKVPPPAEGAGFAAWPTLQKLHFLDSAITACERGDLSTGSVGSAYVPPALLLAGLSSAYGLGTSGNAEIRLRWSQLVAMTAYGPGFESLRDFLRSTGTIAIRDVVSVNLMLPL